MPRPPRRRISPFEVNRYLQSPLFAASSRSERRAVRDLLKALDHADVGRFEIVTGD